jgi:hypothetical protein
MGINMIFIFYFWQYWGLTLGFMFPKHRLYHAFSIFCLSYFSGMVSHYCQGLASDLDTLNSDPLNS